MPSVKFSDDIRAFASTSTQSIDDINKSVYAAISAGISYGDSLDFLRVAEQAAVAGAGDLESTTKVLVSALNAYGASADQAGQFSDALFTAIKLGQTTLPELASSLGLVTGQAASAGVSFDELLAIIAAVTAAGLSTSQSITGIKAALSNIIKPTKDASDVAERARHQVQCGRSGIAWPCRADSAGRREDRRIIGTDQQAVRVCRGI